MKSLSFFHICRLAETASTNDDAKRAAKSGEAEGLVIQALRQTAGKGRQGRAWESPEGNLYMSVLLRPCCSPQEAGLYTFVTALAVYDAVRVFLPQADIALKWPNDVLVNGKKICGILLEAAPVEYGLVDWLVIGIGVNVEHYPENPLYPVTSLMNEVARFNTSSLEGAGTVTVAETMERVLLKFLEWKQVMLTEGFASVRAAWLGRAKKGPIEARLPNETVRGEFKSLDEHGRLIINLPDSSERAIAAGDVFFGGTG